MTLVQEATRRLCFLLDQTALEKEREKKWKKMRLISAVVSYGLFLFRASVNENIDCLFCGLLVFTFSKTFVPPLKVCALPIIPMGARDFSVCFSSGLWYGKLL